MPTMRKVIERYIKRRSFGEISRDLNLARFTVQSAIERWRNGLSGIFDEHLGYLEEILELEKYIRSTGTKTATYSTNS